jgi:outer membrane protein assembly factor BamB
VACAGVVLLAIWGAGIGAAIIAIRHEPKSSALDTKLDGVKQPKVAVQPTKPPVAAPPKAAEVEGPCWPTYGRTAARTSDASSVSHGVPKTMTWQLRIGIMEFPPSFCDGVLYVNNQRGVTWAIDTARKRVIWHRQSATTFDSTPAISGSRVFIGSYLPGDIQALDRRTGKLLWRLQTGGGVESSPVVSGGLVYATSRDRRVYAIDEATGKVRWAFRTGGEVKDSPTVVNGLVYVANYAGEVFALNARNGHVQWRRSVGGGVRGDRIYSSVPVVGGRAYFGTIRGNIHAVDARTGRDIWVRSIPGYLYATPAIAEGTLFVGNYPGRVYAFSTRTGSELWSRYIGGSISGSPTVIGDLVYISSLSGRRTLALSRKTGRIAWELPQGRYVSGIATDRAIYLSLNDTLSRWTSAEGEARHGKPGSRSRVGATAAATTAFG